VIAFFDMTFRELGRWTGRCHSADEWIFTEVVPDRNFDALSDEAKRNFNNEYDRRFRDDYARETINEWQRLLSEEDI
jgi:hypothetical protein